MRKLLSVMLLLSVLLSPVVCVAESTWHTGRQGYQSEVKVSITFSDGGGRLLIAVDSSGETQGIGSRVAEDLAFLNQFLTDDEFFVAGINCEVVSGATVTSNAVIDAVNGIEGPAWNGLTILTTAEAGFASDAIVRVGYNVKEGTIAKISLFTAGETPGFGTRCAEDETFLSQFIGQVPPFAAGVNCDVLSGATVTSNAVIECLNRLLLPESTAE